MHLLLYRLTEGEDLGLVEKLLRVQIHISMYLAGYGWMDVLDIRSTDCIQYTTVHCTDYGVGT